MADYSFERFNSRDFEHFIQALAQKLLGCEVTIFGDGPDGAREATYEGKSSFPGHIECWEGYWVIQSKFKQRCESGDDFSWVKREFEAEMKKFEKKASNNRKIPSNYLFFTNAKLTPLEERGGRDKIEKLCDKYRTNLIPNIKIYGFDDVCRFLDNNRDVAVSYSSFILPGDILHKLFEILSGVGSIKDQSKLLARFLEKEFIEDAYSRLEQGGQVTSNKINLERVFVDLDATEDGIPPKEENKKFANVCITLGNSVLKPEINIGNRFVLIGGPGQGKSTLTQYLCQMYRAYFLKNIDGPMQLPAIPTFITEFKSTGLPEPSCIRFPFRIVLNDYASWLSKQDKAQKNYSILAYIKYRLEIKGNGLIEIEEVRQLLQSLSFIFLFDGLDEVPSTSNRKEVMEEINFFLDTEIRRENCDALIIATTRPQGYTKEFDETRFKHLYLTDLSKKDCLSYLNRLMINIEESDDQRSQHLEILTKALDNETASILMRSPLQATIMAILVLSGGDPPRNRYSLFSRYYEVILTRERQKRVLQVLVDNPEYINAIHLRLGFHLQAMSEGKDNPSATISFGDFEKFIGSYLLNEMGLEKEVTDVIISQLLEAITERLVFISEVQQGRVGFNVRSLQEFFAANYYLHQSDSIIPERLKYISRSSYWRNTFLLGTGYLHNNRSYLVSVIDSICRELNGSSEDYDFYNANKITKIGSWLALDILNEGIFRGKPIDENKFCNYLEDLFKIVPSTNHMYFGKLPRHIQTKWVIPIIDKYLKSSSEPEQITAWTIAVHLIKHDNNDVIEVLKKNWSTEKNTFAIFKHVISLGIENIDFIMEKFIDYLSESTLFAFSKEFQNKDLISELIRRRKSINKRTRAYLIQSFFFKAINDYRNDTFLTSIFLLTEKEIDNNAHAYFFPIRRSRRFIDCNVCENYQVRLPSIINDVDTLMPMEEIAKEYKLEYLYKLIGFLKSPSEESLSIFIKSLELLPQDVFDAVKENVVKLNWVLSEVLKMISSKEEIFIALDRIHNGYFGDINTWMEYEDKVTNSDISFEETIALMKISSHRVSSKGMSFENFYNFYLDRKSAITPDASEILEFELLRVFLMEMPQDKDQNKKILAELMPNISKMSYARHPVIYSNAVMYALSLSSRSEISHIIENEDFDFEEWQLVSRLMYIIPIDYQECFNKILSVLAFEQSESPMIKVLLTIYLGHGKSNELLIDNSNIKALHKLEYKNKELEAIRLSLTLLDKDIDNVQALKITAQVLKIAQYSPDIYMHIILLFEASKYKYNWVEKVLASIYKVIKDQSVEWSLLSHYENYLKNLCESYTSDLDLQIVKDKLQLCSWDEFTT